MSAARVLFIATLVVVVVFVGSGRFTTALGASVASTPSMTCLKTQVAHSTDIHARELAYEQLREGCLPAPGTVQGNPELTALTQQRQLATLSTINGTWTALGPAPINTNNPTYTSGQESYAHASGRIVAMAYDAGLGKAGTLFAGAAQGGVWESTNGGSSWTSLTANFPLAISAITVDPNNPSIIYAGTGEPDSSDSIYGDGVLKSTNGGSTWTLYNHDGTGHDIFQYQSVAALAVDPTNSQQVYAAVALGGFQFSGTVPRNTYVGVAVSSNGGQTWSMPTTQIFNGQTNNGATNDEDSVTDLAVDSSGDLYAAVSGSFYSNVDDCGVWVSTDQGADFTKVNGSTLPGCSSGDTNCPTDVNYKLAMAPDGYTSALGNQTMAVAVGCSAGTKSLLEGVYITANAGAEAASPAGTTAWQQVANTASPESDEDQSDYDFWIQFDPADTSDNTMYLGMTNLYKSTNVFNVAAGTMATWTDLTHVNAGVQGSGETGTPAAIHADQHAFAFTGCTAGTADSCTIYLGNDGGVYRTSDGGATFTDANANLNISQFYHGSVGTSTVIGGLQDNGNVLTTGSGWNSIYTGDGFYTAIDPTSNDQTMYVEYTSGDLQQSTDGGQSFADIAAGLPQNGLFSSPLALDPANPTTLFSAQQQLYYSTNASATTPTWTKASNLISGTCADGSSALSAISVSDSPTLTVYLGACGGYTWRSTNPTAATPTWTPLNSSSCSTSPAPNCAVGGSTVTSLAADPTNANIVYATVNSFESAQQYHVFRGVYQSGSGMTWTDISTSLPNQPFQSIAVNPVTPTTVYAGSDTGVFISTN